ncbi:MAG: PadR family transcriptional regulator [Phycisphaerales bacterium]|nr:PadR family transcriptional regulator [Phycisphaerales bacterium]
MLSELEGAVLGHIWQTGPTTAYAVRRAFETSRTVTFSGSAGAIYPAIERLRERGLVDAAPIDDDRGGHHLRCTTDGIRAIREWIASPPRTLTTDPIRTRMLFAGALTARQRDAWFRSTIESLEADLDAEWTAHHDDPWIRAAQEGAIRSLDTRLEWLREVAKTASA